MDDDDFTLVIDLTAMKKFLERKLSKKFLKNENFISKKKVENFEKNLKNFVFFDGLSNSDFIDISLLSLMYEDLMDL